MIAKKILVLGGSGQVGFELIRIFSLQGTILAPTRLELDLLSPAQVDQYLNFYRPSLILNAAAYTAVDKAESEGVLANRMNHELPAQLAAWAANSNAYLVHYSSDYVYPGHGAHAWSETDTTGPCNRYGQTKLDGDNAVLKHACDFLIFRTSWVYSSRGHNFMKTMLSLGKNRSELSIVCDQIGAPTPARLIALVTLHSVLKAIPSGVYHLAPRGETSWHGFAQQIFDFATVHGAELAIKSDGLRGIPTSAYPTPAVRPNNSRLNLNKLEEALNLVLPSWEDQLQLTIQEYFQ